MDIAEGLKKLLQEWLTPELEKIHHDLAEQRGLIMGIAKRLDDVNLHLADQSRRIDETNKRIDIVHADMIKRIDAVHADSLKRFDEVNRRFDETNKRIDAVHADSLKRFDEVNRRFDETKQRIDAVHVDAIKRFDELQADVIKRADAIQSNVIHRFDSLNGRLDRFEEVFVRRKEQDALDVRMAQIERRLDVLEQRIAA